MRQRPDALRAHALLHLKRIESHAAACIPLLQQPNAWFEQRVVLLVFCFQWGVAGVQMADHSTLRRVANLQHAKPRCYRKHHVTRDVLALENKRRSGWIQVRCRIAFFDAAVPSVDLHRHCSRGVTQHDHVIDV
ncbi:hypothetical protein AB672_10880 [Xylella taiwanensis]|nr:hypothetical protein AB672_10880 [Xylella taiwanensis]